MTNRLFLLALISAGLLVAGGCSNAEPAADSSGAKAQAEPSDNATASASTTVVDGIPESLFVTELPDEAQPLIDVKTSAQAGDRVTFEARIGGRMDPFVDGRAMFFVTDASIKSCDQLHGDACKTPWDYCCEPKDNLLKHMATVQVVDGDGRPVKANLKDSHGLAPLRTVYVTGTVQNVDETGNLVVNAEEIHVSEG